MMNKTALVFLFMFSFMGKSYADIIVHDPVSAAKAAAQWVKEGKQWVDELKAYQDELLSKTGIRDVQGLIQDAQSISSDLTSIYNEGTSFYDDYINNPQGILSGKAQELLNKYKVGENCINQGFTGDLIKGCEARFLSDLAAAEYGEKLQEKVINDNSSLDKLINQVKNSTDPKETADAANAIALEQLKFEKTKFQYEIYRDKQKAIADYKKEMIQAEFKKQQLQATIPDYKKAYRAMQFEQN